MQPFATVEVVFITDRMRQRQMIPIGLRKPVRLYLRSRFNYRHVEHLSYCSNYLTFLHDL